MTSSCRGYTGRDGGPLRGRQLQARSRPRPRAREQSDREAPTSGEETTVVWLRRDLRLADNPALTEASSRGRVVVPVVVWPEAGSSGTAGVPGGAARWWLARSLAALDGDLRRRGSALVVRRGAPATELAALATEARARCAVWVAGIDPPQRAEDAAVAAALRARGVETVIVPGANLLVAPDALATAGGTPYQVFTPFWRAASRTLRPQPPLPAPGTLGASMALGLPQPLAGVNPAELERAAIVRWNASFGEVWQPGESGARARLDRLLDTVLAAYAEDRDRPDLEGCSRLSPHLHWGELSARQVWHGVAGRLAEAGLETEAAIGPPSWDEARPGAGHGRSGVSRTEAGVRTLARGAAAFLRQLGWREFGHHLLWHFPGTVAQPLREPFAAFPWREDADDLAAWQRGQTGYPFVDAAMRSLWTTGWMHNRARLVAGSFLVKDLLLPWQEGAAWFWDTLVDADLANNTLGWQWVAGCGADAAPYFRIFNPVTQGRRFDPRGTFVRRWVPEVAGLPDEWLHEPWRAPRDVLAAASVRLGETYPAPVVDHGEARSRALAAYEAIKLGR